MKGHLEGLEFRGWTGTTTIVNYIHAASQTISKGYRLEHGMRQAIL